MSKNKFLLIVSIFFSLAMIEILTRLIITPPDYSQINRNYLLFEENEIFKNEDNFFTYHPNKKILSRSYHYTEENFLKVYSYYIQTNNFGLVQDNDLDLKKKSILLLGDSFTEGQGAYSWVNKFKGSFKNYQIINGGLLGTGPKQFFFLENYLSQNLNINKVIFIFIGGDFMRGDFVFSKNVAECLKDEKKCIGNESFYGFDSDKNEKQIKLYLEKLRKYRESNTNKDFKYFRRELKNKLKSLNIISIPKSFFESNYYITKNSKFKKNLEKTEKLIKKYKNNIIFIRLNTKQEILYGKSYWSNNIEKELKKRNKKIFYCNFNNDVNLFYKYDGHPNSKGYDYLYNCINKILIKEIN